MQQKLPPKWEGNATPDQSEGKTDTFSSMEISASIASVPHSLVPCAAATPLSDRLRTKLIFTWQQLAASKLCFGMLKDDLLRSMSEANDIFNSMSVPLIRLVGLKEEEMKEEGRRSSVALSSNPCQEIVSPAQLSPSSISKSGNWLREYEEQSFRNKAAGHVAQFSDLQRQQMRQLIGLVKMVETLVRSQEQDISDKFQDHEAYFHSLQKKYISRFRCLNEQVEYMSHQDSPPTHRLRVAEQSYRALMCLAVKSQQSLFDYFRKNLINLKAEMEGMVNELASQMCQPLITFLKQFKSQNMTSLVSKLQSLIEQMESEIAENVSLLFAGYDKVRANVKHLELSSQIQKNKLQAVSRQLEIANQALEEKAKVIESQKQAIADSAANEMDLQACLHQKNQMLSKLEVELEQNRATLRDTQHLLSASQKKFAVEHARVEEERRSSRELGEKVSVIQAQLSFMRNNLKDQVIVKIGETTEKSKLVREQDQVSHSASEETNSQHPEVKGLRQILMKKAPSPSHSHGELIILGENGQQKDSQQRWKLRQVVKHVIHWISQVKDIQVLIKDASENSEDEFLTELISDFVILCESDVTQMLRTKAEPRPTALKDWLPLFLLLAHLNYPGNERKTAIDENTKWNLTDVVLALNRQILDMKQHSLSPNLQLITFAIALVLENKFSDNLVQVAIGALKNSLWKQNGYAKQLSSLKPLISSVAMEHAHQATSYGITSVGSAFQLEKHMAVDDHASIPRTRSPLKHSDAEQTPTPSSCADKSVFHQTIQEKSLSLSTKSSNELGPPYANDLWQVLELGHLAGNNPVEVRKHSCAVKTKNANTDIRDRSLEPTVALKDVILCSNVSPRTGLTTGTYAFPKLGQGKMTEKSKGRKFSPRFPEGTNGNAKNDAILCKEQGPVTRSWSKRMLEEAGLGDYPRTSRNEAHMDNSKQHNPLHNRKAQNNMDFLKSPSKKRGCIGANGFH